MTTNDVQDAVENVSQALDTAKDQNEQVAALEKFQTEVETDMRGMSTEESQDYMGHLTNALEESGQLPVLSLAFADQLGGNLDRDDLSSEMRTTNRFATYGNHSARLDQVFLKYLTDNYDQGENLIEASNNNWVWTDSSISSDDIAKKLTEFRENRDERKRVADNQEKAGPYAATLLNGGEKSLFNFIDRYSQNNSLSKLDLTRYLADAEASGSTDGMYAEHRQQTVKELLRNWDSEDKGAWMRGGFRTDGYPSSGLSKESLLKSTGYASEQGLMAEYARRSAELTAENETMQAEDEQPESDDESNSESQVESNDENVAGGDPEAELSAADDQNAVPSEALEQEEEPQSVPETVGVAKGDSYWRIAHKLLGESATNQEIFAKMMELQELNNNAPLIWNPDNQQKIVVVLEKTPFRTAVRPDVVSI